MTTIPTTNISFSSIYNAFNEPDHNGSDAISISSFRGESFSDSSTVPTSGAISLNTDFKGKDTNTGGGGPAYPPGIITLTPFETVEMGKTTHTNNYKIEYEDELPITFTDSGGTRNPYLGDDDYYVTFWSPYGLRFWTNAGGSNMYEFEKMSYSQYDRLGFTVSNTTEEELGNFQSAPEYTNGGTGEITEPWLQGSGQPNPPWDRSFSGGSYREATNGYIFPADTRRGEELGQQAGRAMDIEFQIIRFYFQSDRYSSGDGWNFSVYPLKNK